MITNVYKAKNVNVESFQELSGPEVESKFEQWKKQNSECTILDISYACCMSPVKDSYEGRIFSLYVITIAYATESKGKG
ncbi:hypothetical protein ES703_39817 [subsurface metagenome]